MKRFLLSLVLAALSFTILDAADAQRGRPRVITPHEMRRVIEQARTSSETWRRRNLISGARQIIASEGLSPTPESFSRTQAALAFLSQIEPSSKQLETRTTNSLLQGRDGLHRLEPLFFATSDGHGYARDILPSVAVFDGVASEPEQFRARFGRPMTAQDSADLASYHQALQRTGAYTGRTLNETMNRSERLVLIVAHNENGRIVNGEGQTVRLEDVANTCSRLVKLCYFVVCRSERNVAESGVGMVGRINLRRSASLVEDLARIAASAQVGSDGNMLLPTHTVFEMMRRVDREGGTMRLVGYRTANWFSVRLILITPRCDQGQC